MRLAVLICFVLLWFANYALLSAVYDITVYDQYLAFWETRAILYDGMFFCFSLILFMMMKGVERAIACFMVAITACSVIDKSVFDITGYAYSDIVLIISSIVFSVIVYGRDRKRDGKSLR